MILKASLYDVDNEDTVVSLGEWYHTVAPDAKTFPTADSVLFNGIGRYTSGPAVPFFTLNVEQNKRYDQVSARNARY
jgi:iron transport multicopper oxidase